jgi:methyl acetate hydrolase
MRKLTGIIMMQMLPFVEPQAIDTFAKFETATYRSV